MKAWVVRANGEPADVLELREVAPPEPGPGFLRMRVDAFAIGLPDVLMCRGTYPLTPAGEFTPGQEIVGVVTAVGEGVDPRLLGTRQMGVTAFYLGQGGFADQAIAAEATVFPSPEWMEDVDAAGFHIPFYTARIALHDRAALAEGETLAVLGAAGGSGAAAVQLGRALGARVIAVAGGEEKAHFCLEHGAHQVVDHRREDVAEALLSATRGRGVDVVFDPVGGAAAESIAPAVADRGRFLLVGFAAGRWPSIDAATLVQRNFSAIGVYAGAYHREHALAAYAALLPMMRDGALASVVNARVPFHELPSGLTGLSDRSTMGKAVLLPRAGATA